MPTWEQEQKYWAAQLKVIALLRALGIQYTLDDRIPAFKVRLQLREKLRAGALPPIQQTIEEAIAAVDRLVAGRMNGAEPPHKDGRYISKVQTEA